MEYIFKSLQHIKVFKFQYTIFQIVSFLLNKSKKAFQNKVKAKGEKKQGKSVAYRFKKAIMDCKGVVRTHRRNVSKP